MAAGAASFVCGGIEMRRRKLKQGATPTYQLGPACVYSRISGAGDTRGASLETQEQRIIERLRELGYEVGHEDIFRDKFTGKETIRRTALNKMREAIREGKYRAVGVYKLDRLSRNMGQTFILLAEMDELEVRPISVLEPDIDNSPTGKLYRMMGGYMAEMELASLEDRFGRGREFIQQRGLPLGAGHAPYGMFFKKKERVFVLDEDDDDHEGVIKWVRVMYRKMADGESAHAVSAYLNAVGAPSPGKWRGLKLKKGELAGRWWPATVIGIVRNPAYKGWTVEGRYYSEGTSDSGHSILQANPEDQWIVLDRNGVITPRVVDEATWAAAQALVWRNAMNRNSQGRRRHAHLLRGMVFCLKCGAKMYPKINQHGNTLYQCGNHVQVATSRRDRSLDCDAKRVFAYWLEPLVWGQLRELLVTPGRLEAAISRMLANAPTDDTARDLSLAEANLAEQERVREKIYRKWREEESRHDPDEELAAKWEADYRGMKGPIESLRRTVETLRRRVAEAANPEKVAQQAAERFAAIRERLLLGDDLSDEEKRDALLMAKTRVLVESNGRRQGKAGGTGEVHFYLFDEGTEPNSASAGSGCPPRRRGSGGRSAGRGGPSRR
jgi:site-specific DNA recombinase